MAALLDNPAPTGTDETNTQSKPPTSPAEQSSVYLEFEIQYHCKMFISSCTPTENVRTFVSSHKTILLLRNQKVF